VFFSLRPSLDLHAVDRELRQRRALDETRTRCLLVDLVEITDTAHISFTVFDSHRSYAERCPADPGDPAPATPVERDQGTIFRIDEAAEVLARNRHIQDLSFEVQVWNPSILPSPSQLRLPTPHISVDSYS
jgi:hypothetical protein